MKITFDGNSPKLMEICIFHLERVSYQNKATPSTYTRGSRSTEVIQHTIDKNQSTILFALLFPSNTAPCPSLMLMAGGQTTTKLQSGQSSQGNPQSLGALMGSLLGVWGFRFQETSFACLTYHAPNKDPQGTCLIYITLTAGGTGDCVCKRTHCQATSDLKVSQADRSAVCLHLVIYLPYRSMT